MAQNRSGHRPGGGLHSKVVRHVTEPKREPTAYRINQASTNYLGNAVGDHVTNRDKTGWRPKPLYGGAGYNAPVGPTNLAQSGPGAGRTVMKSGQQNQWGQPASGNAPAKNRDTLSEYGPESK